MRLGGPAFGDTSSPEAWIAAVKAEGYRAAYCPVDNKADDTTVRAYADAAHQADIVIAEVGAWSNPLSPDEETRRKAVAFCTEQLALADRIGARCCVNISGARGTQWDGPDASHYDPETFDMIVETTRQIIDAVRPTRTFYTLETMPWITPDSPESYVQLIEAIDRPQFAAHLDPVNLINTPRLFYRNADFIRKCFRLLGPHIRSCHGKDIALTGRMITHIDEVRPGLGVLDYGVFLSELNKLAPDTPLMLEHLPNADEYRLAAQHVRAVAAETGVTL